MNLELNNSCCEDVDWLCVLRARALAKKSKLQCSCSHLACQSTFLQHYINTSDNSKSRALHDTCSCRAQLLDLSTKCGDCSKLLLNTSNHDCSSTASLAAKLGADSTAGSCVWTSAMQTPVRNDKDICYDREIHARPVSAVACYTDIVEVLPQENVDLLTLEKNCSDTSANIVMPSSKNPAPYLIEKNKLQLIPNMVCNTSIVSNFESELEICTSSEIHEVQLSTPMDAQSVNNVGVDALHQLRSGVSSSHASAPLAHSDMMKDVANLGVHRVKRACSVNIVNDLCASPKLKTKHHSQPLHFKVLARNLFSSGLSPAPSPCQQTTLSSSVHHLCPLAQHGCNSQDKRFLDSVTDGRNVHVSKPSLSLTGTLKIDCISAKSVRSASCSVDDDLSTSSPACDEPKSPTIITRTPQSSARKFLFSTSTPLLGLENSRGPSSSTGLVSGLDKQDDKCSQQSVVYNGSIAGCTGSASIEEQKVKKDGPVEQEGFVIKRRSSSNLIKRICTHGSFESSGSMLSALCKLSTSSMESSPNCHSKNTDLIDLICSPVKRPTRLQRNAAIEQMIVNDDASSKGLTGDLCDVQFSEGTTRRSQQPCDMAAHNDLLTPSAAHHSDFGETVARGSHCQENVAYSSYSRKLAGSYSKFCENVDIHSQSSEKAFCRSKSIDKAVYNTQVCENAVHCSQFNEMAVDHCPSSEIVDHHCQLSKKVVLHNQMSKVVANSSQSSEYTAHYSQSSDKSAEGYFSVKAVNSCQSSEKTVNSCQSSEKTVNSNSCQSSDKAVNSCQSSEKAVNSCQSSEKAVNRQSSEKAVNSCQSSKKAVNSCQSSEKVAHDSQSSEKSSHVSLLSEKALDHSQLSKKPANYLESSETVRHSQSSEKSVHVSPLNEKTACRSQSSDKISCNSKLSGKVVDHSEVSEKVTCYSQSSKRTLHHGHSSEKALNNSQVNDSPAVDCSKLIGTVGKNLDSNLRVAQTISKRPSDSENMPSNCATGAGNVTSVRNTSPPSDLCVSRTSKLSLTGIKKLEMLRKKQSYAESFVYPEPQFESNAKLASLSFADSINRGMELLGFIETDVTLNLPMNCAVNKLPFKALTKPKGNCLQKRSNSVLMNDSEKGNAARTTSPSSGFIRYALDNKVSVKRESGLNNKAGVSFDANEPWQQESMSPDMDEYFMGKSTQKIIEEEESFLAKSELRLCDEKIYQLRNAKFDSIDRKAEHHDVTSDAALSIGKRNLNEMTSIELPSKHLKTSATTAVFKTGRGNCVSVNETSLEKAAQLWKESERSPCTLELNSVLKQTSVFSEVESADTESDFLVPSVSPTAVRCKKIGLESAAYIAPFCMLDDRSENGISSDRGNCNMDAEVEIRKIFENTCRNVSSNSTAAKSGITNYGGFTTARGTSVKVSEAALQKAQMLWKESSHEFSVSACESLNKPDETAVKLADKTNDSFKQGYTKDGLSQRCSATGISSFVGFSTANGTVPKVSVKAIKKAQMLWEEASCNSSSITGFSASRAPIIKVSSDSLNKAKRLWSDCNDPETFDSSSSFQGFATAKGSLLKVSNEALTKARKLWMESEDCNEVSSLCTSEDRNFSTGFFGFKTAKGSYVNVDDESLKKAKRLWTECDANADVDFVINKQFGEPPVPKLKVFVKPPPSNTPKRGFIKHCINRSEVSGESSCIPEPLSFSKGFSNVNLSNRVYPKPLDRTAPQSVPLGSPSASAPTCQLTKNKGVCKNVIPSKLTAEEKTMLDTQLSSIAEEFLNDDDDWVIESEKMRAVPTVDTTNGQIVLPRNESGVGAARATVETAATTNGGGDESRKQMDCDTCIPYSLNCPVSSTRAVSTSTVSSTRSVSTSTVSSTGISIDFGVSVLIADGRSCSSPATDETSVMSTNMSHVTTEGDVMPTIDHEAFKMHSVPSKAAAEVIQRDSLTVVGVETAEAKSAHFVVGNVNTLHDEGVQCISSPSAIGAALLSSNSKLSSVSVTQRNDMHLSNKHCDAVSLATTEIDLLSNNKEEQHSLDSTSSSIPSPVLLSRRTETAADVLCGSNTGICLTDRALHSVDSSRTACRDTAHVFITADGNPSVATPSSTHNLAGCSNSPLEMTMTISKVTAHSTVSSPCSHQVDSKSGDDTEGSSSRDCDVYHVIDTSTTPFAAPCKQFVTSKTGPAVSSTAVPDPARSSSLLRSRQIQGKINRLRRLYSSPSLVPLPPLLPLQQSPAGNSTLPYRCPLRKRGSDVH